MHHEMAHYRDEESNSSETPTTIAQMCPWTMPLGGKIKVKDGVPIKNEGLLIFVEKNQSHFFTSHRVCCCTTAKD